MTPQMYSPEAKFIDNLSSDAGDAFSWALLGTGADQERPVPL